MPDFKSIRDTAVRWAVFGSFAALFMGWIAYALTYNWSDPSALRGKTAGNPLQSSQWNLLVGNVDNLNERLTNAETTVWSLSSAMPTGAVVAFYGSACPTGWSAANGAVNGVKKTDGTAGTLDLRGEFVRGLDSGRNVDLSRALGSSQGDAIRNITGQFGNGFYGEVGSTNATGVFVANGSAGNTKYTSATWTSNGPLVDFDASRIVPTASENRPRNVALLYCVKN